MQGVFDEIVSSQLLLFGTWVISENNSSNLIKVYGLYCYIRAALFLEAENLLIYMPINRRKKSSRKLYLN